MRPDNTHNRPTLLLISGCFPAPDRSVEAARAWRLMCCAAKTHQVYLVTAADRPVNLSQWRQVADRVHRVQIAPSGRRWFSPSPVCGEIKTWARQRRFDIMLAMSHRVWPVGCRIEADVKLCDLSSDLPGANATGESRLSHPRVGEVSLPDAVQARMARVIRACDTLMVGSDRQSETLRGHTTPIITLTDDSAEATWSRHFGQSSVAVTIPPSVSVMHVQPKPLRRAA